MMRRLFLVIGVLITMCLVFIAGRLFPLRAGCLIDPMIGEFPTGITTYVKPWLSSRSCDLVVMGKPLTWVVSTDMLKQTPSWTNREACPPPLSVDKAIAISKQEVPKYFTNTADWVVREITVETLGRNDKWYYVVDWLPPDATGDGLEIPVLMSGFAVSLAENKNGLEAPAMPAKLK
jgi:hypothetical protein